MSIVDEMKEFYNRSTMNKVISWIIIVLTFIGTITVAILLIKLFSSDDEDENDQKEPKEEFSSSNSINPDERFDFTNSWIKDLLGGNIKGTEQETA